VRDGVEARLLRRSVRMTRTTSRMVVCSAALLLGSGGAAYAQAPRVPTPLHGASRWIVVSNERSHDLTLLDGTTLEPVGTIPVPGGPRPVGVSHSPDR
jgi:hypothetical protein